MKFRGVDAPQRRLFVDGNNILHAWGWVRASGMVVARTRLIEVLRIVHDLDAVDITIVFDGRGPTAQVDPTNAAPGFAVHFAASGLTADGVIERLVASGASSAETLVATADAAVDSNISAAGATCLSPAALFAWIERCGTRARRKLQTRQAAQQARFTNKLPL